MRRALVWLQAVQPPRCARFLVLSLHCFCDLVPSHQGISPDGGQLRLQDEPRLPATRSRGTSHRKSPCNKTAMAGPTPAPSCPLPWSHRVHKASAGITGRCTLSRLTRRPRGRLAAAIVGGGVAAPALAQPLAPQSSDHIEVWPGLFKDEYAFARAALTQLALARDWLQWTANDAEQGLAITAPPDLRERLRAATREVRSSNGRYELCADPARVKQAIEQARQARAEDDTWPQLHYLWPRARSQGSNPW